MEIGLSRPAPAASRAVVVVVPGATSLTHFGLLNTSDLTAWVAHKTPPSGPSENQSDDVICFGRDLWRSALFGLTRARATALVVVWCGSVFDQVRLVFCFDVSSCFRCTPQEVMDGSLLFEVTSVW
ncbi:hypothetical protein BaRGS_00025995 [Batillaria attramentaria]|uniref:Uncharacterized protein n=1 Tax=Batillaria attramentaria TaxID=370345 RepID=A0ABD0K686_9CAEN